MALPVRAIAAEPRPRFYFRISLAMATLAVVGFVPSFWAPMAHGVFVPHPVLTIHGLIASVWPWLMVYQSWLVATGRTARHRDLGLAGIAVATAMVIFGVMAAIDQTRRAASVGALEAGLTFMILPIAQVALFAVLVAWAFANIHRPEWHKRILVVATALAVSAAFGRLGTYFLVFHGRLPVPAGMPSPPPPVDAGLVLEPFTLIGIAYDWRTRGRPHAAYLIGGAAVVLVNVLRPALSRTSAWHAVAEWILSLAR